MLIARIPSLCVKARVKAQEDEAWEQSKEPESIYTKHVIHFKTQIYNNFSNLYRCFEFTIVFPGVGSKSFGCLVLVRSNLHCKL